MVRYETDVDIEKRFTSGLTVAQREHCCTHYPDADARKEALIDLVYDDSEFSSVPQEISR